MRRWWVTDPRHQLRGPGLSSGQAWGALCSREPRPLKPRPLKPRGHQSHACFPLLDATRGSLAKASVVWPGGRRGRGSDFRPVPGGECCARPLEGFTSSSRTRSRRFPVSVQKGLGCAHHTDKLWRAKGTEARLGTVTGACITDTTPASQPPRTACGSVTCPRTPVVGRKDSATNLAELVLKEADSVPMTTQVTTGFSSAPPPPCNQEM